MGVIVQREDGRRVHLRLCHVVGRASSCHLRLARAEVSGLHAALRWSARGWELRDLGSTNGTLVDGQVAPSGQWMPVTSGSELAFGHPDHRWTLESDAAPPARAFPTDGGAPVEERGGLLVLPEGGHAEVLAARGVDGQWVIEDGDGVVSPVGDRVRAGDREWDLELPEADPRTPLVQHGTLPRVALCFRVSADEEHVEVRVRVGSVEHDLGARAHHYLLLTLARLRVRDEAAEPAATAEHGWVHLPQLTRMLRLDERPLNLQIFRVRRQLAELALPCLPEVIERRRGTGQLRLGSVDVTIA